MPQFPMTDGVVLPSGKATVELLCLEVEADEMLRFRAEEKEYSFAMGLACF